MTVIFYQEFLTNSDAEGFHGGRLFGFKMKAGAERQDGVGAANPGVLRHPNAVRDSGWADVSGQGNDRFYDPTADVKETPAVHFPQGNDRLNDDVAAVKRVSALRLPRPGNDRLGDVAAAVKKGPALRLPHQGNDTVLDIVAAAKKTPAELTPRHAQHVHKDIAVSASKTRVVERSPDPVLLSRAVGQSRFAAKCMTNLGLKTCWLMPTPSTKGDPQCCCDAKEDESLTCFPYFFIIGEQKSGTTALLAYMMLSTSVLIPRKKETHFFDLHANMRGSPRKLLSRLPRNPDPASKVAVDATPSYVLNRQTSQGISRWLPEAKAILVVRDPVDRAWSEYQMVVRRLARWYALLDKVEPLASTIQACMLEHRQEKIRPQASNKRKCQLQECVSSSARHLGTQAAWRLSRFVCSAQRRGFKPASFFVVDAEGLHLNRTTMTPPRLREGFEVRVRREMKLLAPCIELSGEGGRQKATLRENDTCVQEGLNSNIEFGGHVYRSMYSHHVQGWLESFSSKQLHIVSHSQLSNDGLRAVEAVCNFLGLPPFLNRALTREELDTVIETNFPVFRDSSGWVIDGVSSYEKLSGSFRGRLEEFFLPFNNKLAEILESSFGWSAKAATSPF